MPCSTSYIQQLPTPKALLHSVDERRDRMMYRIAELELQNILEINRLQHMVELVQESYNGKASQESQC
jgi:hypothetical protein